MAGRNMRKLTVSDALEYMRQISEIESKNDNGEEVVFSDDEYVPPDKENISSDKDTVSNFPVQYSNPDEMKSGTFVRNDETRWGSITSRSCIHGRIAEHNVFKEKSSPISYAKRNIENGYAISPERLLIDEPKLRHIKNCTEEEAHRQLGKKE
ncbi:hypothetical protein TNCV_4503131 [Trichonephila clavipes]|nr:hypothetical protein TNCV_4503131 [Trichonephila clavipes]